MDLGMDVNMLPFVLGFALSIDADFYMNPRPKANELFVTDALFI